MPLDEQTLRDLYETIDKRIAQKVPGDVISLRRGTITEVSLSNRTVMVRLDGGDQSTPVHYPSMPVDPSVDMEVICAVGSNGWISLAWMLGGPEIVSAIGQISTNLVPDASAPRTTAYQAARYAADADSVGIVLDKSRGTEVGQQGQTLSGDGLGHLLVRGSTGTAMQSAALLQATAPANYSDASSPGQWQFYTTASGSISPTNRMTLSETGTLLVGTPPPTERAAGGYLQLGGYGISFPATAALATDVNTLDDYEEGTWTPTWTFATPGNFGASYTVNFGSYTKIGDRVFWDCLIQSATFTHTTAAGDLRITGLPFVVSAYYGAGSCAFSGHTGTARTWVTPQTVAGTSYMVLNTSADAAAIATLSAATVPSLSNPVILAFGTYRV
jgi:hypothetical protein